MAGNEAKLRADFLQGVLRGLRVTWPILSVLLTGMAGLGAVVGVLEGWGIGAGVYFAFVTGLTIGYGDLAPSGMVARIVAIAIGFVGIILTGVVAAIAVAALRPETERPGSTG